MRISRSVVFGITALALTASLASAQEKKLHINLGGGPTFNAGDLGDHFGNGWGPAIGVTYDFTPMLGFQFEYAYRYFHIKDDAPLFGATRFEANHQTHQLDFNLVASLAAPGASIRPYVVAGPGVYNRKVEITQYEGTGVICDPFYYICGTYPVTSVVGSRGGWDPGFNVGGGVGFRVGESSEIFIEMRYHYVSGPDIQPTATPLGTVSATGGSTNGSYYPLTFGFRF